MLSAIFLFIPLLAGYLFAVTWKFSRYRSAREDSQRLYFRAAFYGLFLAGCALLTLANVKLYLPSIVSALSAFLKLTLPAVWYHPDKDSPTLTAEEWSELALFVVLTVLWGGCLGFGLNRGWYWLNEIIDEVIRQHNPSRARRLNALQRGFKKLVQERGDDFELLLFTALDRTAPLLVTMENRKVYVGTVVELVEPHIDRKHLRLLPLLSGYRSEEDCDVVFTTSYDEIYNQILADSDNDDIKHLSPDDFEVVLPVQLIQSISLFDFSAYLRFSNAHVSSHQIIEA